ncbi:MAG: hypothetical protein KJ755_05160 [Alphaproteobacteria bacterium]|nr:hypothetical protein [Alphaproteobacteria bacterium]
MGLLLSGGDAARRASPKTASLQKVIDIRKCCKRHARRTKFHACAGRRIKHPRGDHHEDAGENLDVDKLPGSTPVNALDPQASTEKRMPAVMDHNKLPDMGRMNGR